MLISKRKIRILNFDIENRPLSYWLNDTPTAEITAIASCWTGDFSSMEVLLLGALELEEILSRFVERYNEADMVVGHYIRKHDLPTINGALLEMGLPQLSPKLTCDTKLDMYKKANIPASQEYLAALLKTPIQKIHMTQHDWREANRLTPEGRIKASERCAGDVYTNMLMREKMLKLNLLKSPKVWHP
jgi:hypothetical protein